MENLLNYAVQYAKHGFSVIPTAGKKPLVKFADKPQLSVNEIESFWRKNPFANIALKTDRFFVIDVDQHEGGENGIESIKDLNHPEWFEGTLCQKTAHGGLQYFFAKPTGMKIAQNIAFLPGVDIKAHPNNYVVVAPSKMDGGAYEWLNTNPMLSPSEGLLALIKDKSKPAFEPSQVGANYTPGRRTQTTELFESIVNGLGETGGRNNALAAFCGGLLFRNVDVEAVYKLAVVANQNTPNPLPPKEVETTVLSMIKKEERRRGVGNED